MTRMAERHLAPSPWRALAVAAVLILPAGPAAAQEGEEAGADVAPPAAERVGPSTSIEGFRGLEWGTSEAEIIAVFGEPVERRRLENGLQLLAYRDSLVGRPSLLLFGLLEADGLVKAQEVIDVEAGNACIETIREIHRDVNLQYPLIRPAAQAKNNTPETICDAAPEGLAYWHRQWRDETTGSVVTVSLASGSDEIDLIYESGRFREWVAPEGAQADVVDDEGASDEALRAQP